MITTLVLPGWIEQEIRGSMQNPLESAGVLLARRVETGADVRLLARSMHSVCPEAYIEQTATHMLIGSEGYVPALSLAEADGAVPIWFHTHPGSTGVPLPSRWDRKVDEDIADLFRLRSGSEYYGTLIASPRGEGLAFSGTLQSQSGKVTAIDRIWAVGERWRLTPALTSKSESPHEIFDRNVRAFGPAIQTILGDIRVAIAGAGGTGSAVAEQLVRLGVRHLLLVDADDLSASNVTRVYGSTPADVGRQKVDVLKAHLLAIAPDLECQVLPEMGTLPSADPGQDRALAPDPQKPHPAGKLLPAGRLGGPDRGVHRPLQSPPVSREPRQPDPCRRLLRPRSRHPRPPRPNQTTDHRNSPLAAPQARRLTSTPR